MEAAATSLSVRESTNPLARLALSAGVFVVMAMAVFVLDGKEAKAQMDIWGYATSPTSIHIEWMGGPGGQAELERDGHIIPGVTGNTSIGSYEDTGRICGTYYRYQLFDIDYGEESYFADISTQACPPPPDSSPPTLSSRNPAPGTHYRNAPLNVAVTYADNIGVQYVRHCLGYGTCEPGTDASSTFTNGSAIDSGVYDDSPGATGFSLCTRARDAAGNWSGTDCAHYERRMAAPSSLTATAFGGDDIDLNWYDNSNEESGYYVYRSYNGGSYTYIATTSPFGGIGAGNYQDYNVGCGDWKYRVYAFVASADSVVSNESNTISYVCSVAAPYLTNGSCSSTYGTNASCTIYWSQSTPPVPDGFHIFRDGAQIGSASGSSARDYTDGSSSPPQCGQTYGYVVRAFTYSGQNADSDVRYLTTPACPNTAPNTPTITKPANSNWTSDPQICATVSDPDNDDVYAHYDWYWGNANGGDVGSGGSSCWDWDRGSQDLVDLRAQTVDSEGATSSYTSNWRVNFDLTAPTTPGTPSCSPNPSTNGSYTVSWGASSDSHSGVAVYDVYQNGSYNTTTASTSVGYSGKSNGTYTYYVRAFDNVGNNSSASGTGSCSVSTDTTAPTTTNNWTDNWTSSGTVNVTLTATDNSGGSGVDYIVYCIGSSSCSPTEYYSTPVTVSVNCAVGSTCTQYVRYYAADNVGNVESTKQVRVRQDRQAPTPNPATLSGSPGYDSITYMYYINWTVGSASDGGVGLHSSAYGTASASGGPYTWRSSNTYTDNDLESCTSYTQYAKVRDALGNETSVGSRSVTTTGCNNAPSTPTITKPANSNWTSDPQICATVSDPDGNNVYAHYDWYWGNANGGTVGSGGSSCWDWDRGSQGSVDLRAQAVDTSSATSAYTGNWRVNFDFTPPTMGSCTVSPSPSYGGSYTVSWSPATDAHSGSANYYVVYEGGAAIGDTTTTSYAFSGKSVATYDYGIVGYDNAGNYSVGSCSVEVRPSDSDAPTVTWRVEPGTTGGTYPNSNVSTSVYSGGNSSSNNPTIYINYSDSSGIPSLTPPQINWKQGNRLCSDTNYFENCTINSSGFSFKIKWGPGINNNSSETGNIVIPLNFIRDNLGNTVSNPENITVTINNQAPVITIQ